MSDIARLLAVARGDAPADLVLGGGSVINVFTGEIEATDVAICGSRIAGLGVGFEAKRRIDVSGSFVAPGYIDAHVHIESSLCVPAEFAAGVVPRGVTTVVTDPHELANVAGAAGVRFMVEAAKGLPLNVVMMGPSCVPATTMTRGGGTISDADLRELLEAGYLHGLAELMNFPGAIAGDAEVLAKLEAMKGRPVDGHCPGVVGHALSAYAAAGVGSDHESVTPEEAKQKLARGLYLLIREATNARNLDALLPVVTPANSRRVCFCTDDRTPGDLLRVGSIDHMVRRAIAFGIEPVEAIRMATLNPAEWFGLPHVGAIAPGRAADLQVFDDLDAPEARAVFSGGWLVAESGKLLDDVRVRSAPRATMPEARCDVDWGKVDLAVPARGERVRVIGSLPDQLVTEHRVLPATVRDGRVVADPSRDLLKMAVIERHRGTGATGVGFIQGFGLQRGAIAGTVAHDHHNLVCIGADDASMMSAARAVAAMGGGLAVCVGERVLAELPLPVGGLMSDRPIEAVAAGYDGVVMAARGLGSTLSDPFMAMSFMALEVIPALKLTAHGLVDVDHFRLVDLFP